MYEKLKKDDNDNIIKDNSFGIPVYNINDLQQQQQNNNIKITVKNAEDPILYIDLKPNDRIGFLKSTILKLKDKPNYNIRIIYNGKMLREDSMTIADCKLINGSVIICSITEPIIFNEPTIATIPIIPNGTTTSTATINSINTTTATTATTLPITNNRTQNNINIPQEFVIDMERTRLQLNGGLVETTTTSNNGNRFLNGSSPLVMESIELCFGLCFGFFFGPISLFWVTKEYLPRTTKLGIVFGVIFSVCLSLVKLSAQSNTI